MKIFLSLFFVATVANAAVDIGHKGNLSPRDLDGNGSIDAYYDRKIDVTWSASPNYTGKPVPVIKAADVVKSANSKRHLGVSSWRLPHVEQEGILACGPCGGGAKATDPSSSELSHLFYVALGKEAPTDGTELPRKGDYAPFEGILQGSYVATPIDESEAWQFDMWGGGQMVDGDPERLVYIWLVADGDVGK